jgi:hypothetical protein
MILTEDQQHALETFEAFLTSDKTVYLLQGVAGSGKTTTVQYILQTLLKKHKRAAVGLAPTHKAKRVLRERMPDCPVMTVAAMLLKMRRHSTIGTQSYVDGGEGRAAEFTGTCFILDEVSMVADGDFAMLERVARQNQNKILAIGDPYQIPAIAQAQLIIQDDVLRRRPCAVFTKKYPGSTLNQIVRQAGNSPILRVACHIRENIHADISLRALFPEFVITAEKAYELFADNIDIKIVAYTNEAVDRHNLAVRKALGFELPFEVDDVLTGYQNIGYPNLVVENGADYTVTEVTEEKNGLRKRMVGWNTRVTDPEGAQSFFFFPTVGARENKATFSRLVALARKVNAPRSTKKDYAVYKSLKDKLFFLQDLYEFPTNSEMFYTDSELKLKEPLLFTPVADLLDEKGAIIANELYENLKLIYGDLVDTRLADDKAVAESETFASSYCVLEKDLSYGYAYTAHKSQGGTVATVIVDENNFRKLCNRWNFRHQMMEDKMTERNQLKYVACTRASETLYIL